MTKRHILLLSLALVSALGMSSCSKKETNTDPLQATLWYAQDEYNGNMMVLRFELGTLSSFYIGDNNLDRLPDASPSGSTYTLTDDTRVTFLDLNGSYNNDRYRFKSATLDGDTMLVSYDRWTSASSIDSQKQHLQTLFRKKDTSKK